MRRACAPPELYRLGHGGGQNGLLLRTVIPVSTRANGRAAAAGRRRALVCSAKGGSKRVPKGGVGDFEREYGDKAGEGNKLQFTISGVLNYLADVAFGESKSRGNALEDAWSAFVRSLVRFGGRRELPPGPNDVRVVAEAAARATDAEGAAVRQMYASAPDCDDIVTLATGVAVLLQGTARRPDPGLASRIGFLMGFLSKSVQCSSTQSALMIKKAPEILQLESSDIARSLVSLKIICPAANISRMALQSPQLLCLSREQMGTFGGSISVLREALPRVNVDRLIQEDPNIAFMDVRFALEELTELWGKEEMGTIDEEELALALRSISMRPKLTHQYRLEFDARPLAAAKPPAAAPGAAAGAAPAASAVVVTMVEGGDKQQQQQRSEDNQSQLR